MLNPTFKILQLSPFYSVKLEYYIEHCCALPDVNRGYLPDADFIGTSSQVDIWVDSYMESLDDPDGWGERD